MAAGAVLATTRPRIALASTEASHRVITGEEARALARGTSRPGVMRTDAPFRAVGFRLPPGVGQVRARTSADGAAWTEWHTLRLASESGEGPDPGSEEDAAQDAQMTEPLSGSRSEWLEVADADLADLEIHLVDDPGGDRPVRALAAGDEPRIVSRSEWGAATATSGGARMLRPRALVVHHTATTNDYDEDEAAAQVRSFYRYHTQTRGWRDIGYNFLVDRYGTVYEGRGLGVVGAHASGFNSETLGIALIGSFGSRAIPTEAWDALVELLGWLFAEGRVDPRATLALLSRGGSTSRFPAGAEAWGGTLRGHRDLSSTGCPGDEAYADLGSVHDDAAAEAEQRAEPARLGQASTWSSDALDGVIPRLDTRAPTAVGLAVAGHSWNSPSTIVVASSEDFADALCGGALAAAEDAPLLLVPADGPSPWLQGQIAGLTPRRAVVLGGSAAITESADDDLAAAGARVERVYGSDRFATAAAIAERIGAPTGEVAICLGRHEQFDRAWPDALSAAALAATPQPVPTLLSRHDELPETTIDAIRSLGARKAFVIGGEAALSADVEQTLRGLGLDVERLAGADRYGTSRRVLAEAQRRFDTNPRPVVVAPGRSYPEAVAAGALAAREGGGVLLVPSHDLDRATAESLDGVDRGIVVGDPGTISDQVREQLADLVSS